MPPLTIFPIEGVPEIRAGDVLAELLVAAAQEQDTPFEPDDCVVVTQKVVSKAEGRVVPLDASDPGARRALIESEAVRARRPGEPGGRGGARGRERGSGRAREGQGGAGAGGGRPRPRGGVVPRGVGPGARPPAGGGPVPLIAGGVPAFIEARRSIRA